MCVWQRRKVRPRGAWAPQVPDLACAMLPYQAWKATGVLITETYVATPDAIRQSVPDSRLVTLSP